MEITAHIAMRALNKFMFRTEGILGRRMDRSYISVVTVQHIWKFICMLILTKFAPECDTFMTQKLQKSRKQNTVNGHMSCPGVEKTRSQLSCLFSETWELEW